MPKWTIVTVLGRPSANTSDFFNSIKFMKTVAIAATKEEALLNHLAPKSEDGYELLNWYAFSSRRRNGNTAQQDRG